MSISLLVFVLYIICKINDFIVLSAEKGVIQFWTSPFYFSANGYCRILWWTFGVV